MRRFALLLFVLGLPAIPGYAQDSPIQDNSFLIEESYNQEAGVVQEISFYSWSALSHSWVYTFTNEWPMNGLKHQFSYTVSATHPGSSGGIGDTAFNYRYQLVGSGETRLAISPRLSLLVPSGDSRYGRGFGGTGLQTNLPLSVVVHPKLVTHWNAGATWIPRAKNELGDRAGLTGYSLGQSFVYLANPRFNFMLETFYNDMEAVAAPGKTVRQKSLWMSPGIRWAWNFKSGLQVVPGIAAPLGAGPSSGDKGVIVYLSFEQPLKLLKWQEKN
jgi:hypothetical protein